LQADDGWSGVLSEITAQHRCDLSILGLRRHYSRISRDGREPSLCVTNHHFLMGKQKSLCIIVCVCVCVCVFGIRADGDTGNTGRARAKGGMHLSSSPPPSSLFDLFSSAFLDKKKTVEGGRGECFGLGWVGHRLWLFCLCVLLRPSSGESTCSASL
jgi:hypothetical protein